MAVASLSADAARAGAHRMLGLAIQTLARRVLPRCPAGVAVVRLLRAAVRYGGDQQQLLSPARARDVRGLGTPRAGALHVCGEGEPVPDAHEEAEGSRGTDRATVHAHARARDASRARAVPAAARVEGRQRPVRVLSRRAPAG